MAKRKKNSTQKDFNAQAAIDQAWDDLLAASDAGDIINVLARGVWIKTHETETPQSAIPTVGEFLEYATGKEKDQDQIDLANFCFSKQWNRRYTGELKDGFVVAETAQFLRAWVTGERQIKGFAGHQKDRVLMLLSDIDIEIAHALWKKAETLEYTGKHPLSGIVAAWQKEATAVHATKERDQTRPAGILKYPTGSIRDISLAKIGAGVLKNLSGHGDRPNTYQMALPGLEQKSVIRSTQNFLIQEREALTTKSGAVSLAVRIVLEAIIALPGQSTKQRIKFTLGDLTKFLNPDGKFHRTNQLPYIVKALQTLNSNAVVEWEYKKGKFGYWLPVVARSFPSMDSDRDFPIVLDVELPPNATQGPMVMKDALRMTGKKSLPQFNAYLAISEVWDRYGTQDGRIIDPTKPVDYKQPGGERVRNPQADQYPELSNLDLMVACFPNLNFDNMPPNQKRPYLQRAKKYIDELKNAGYVEIEKTRSGWRILPTADHTKTYRTLKG